MDATLSPLLQILFDVAPCRSRRMTTCVCLVLLTSVLLFSFCLMVFPSRMGKSSLKHRKKRSRREDFTDSDDSFSSSDSSSSSSDESVRGHTSSSRRRGGHDFPKSSHRKSETRKSNKRKSHVDSKKSRSSRKHDSDFVADLPVDTLRGQNVLSADKVKGQKIPMANGHHSIAAGVYYFAKNRKWLFKELSRVVFLPDDFLSKPLVHALCSALPMREWNTVDGTEYAKLTQGNEKKSPAK
jgi:hypothetical protein